LTAAPVVWEAAVRAGINELRRLLDDQEEMLVQAVCVTDST
jgi:hypothetical protein